MDDYQLPAPLVGMLRATRLTRKPRIQTDLQATKLSVSIVWDLATSASKKTKTTPQPTVKTTEPPTSKPATKSQQKAASNPTPIPGTKASTYYEADAASTEADSPRRQTLMTSPCRPTPMTSPQRPPSQRSYHCQSSLNRCNLTSLQKA